MIKAASSPRTKKVELVDLDHYLPSKKVSTTGLGALSQFVAETNKSQNTSNAKPSSSRTSFAKLTESMLIAMPVIVEEEDFTAKKIKEESQQSLRALPARQTNANSGKQQSPERHEKLLPAESFSLKSPIHPS